MLIIGQLVIHTSANESWGGAQKKTPTKSLVSSGTLLKRGTRSRE